MSVALLTFMLGCTLDEPRAYSFPGPIGTGVQWEEDGDTESLTDADVGLAQVTAPDGSCTPVASVMLFSKSDDYQVWLNLDSYTDGATVITPEPPFLEQPPTWLRFSSDPRDHITIVSGGPASFALDDAGRHTLTLEAPQRCVSKHLWSVTGDECEPSPTVTITFTADLLPHACDVGATTAEGVAPSGLPWCVSDQMAPGSCLER